MFFIPRHAPSASPQLLKPCIAHTYDAAQRPASVIDKRGITMQTFEYDNGDRLTSTADALIKSANVQYDTAGRVSQVTDRKGQPTTLEYDQAGRITRVNYPDATRTNTYDAQGRLSEVREGSNAISYTYDTVDRITKVTSDSPAGRHDVGYEYDNLDRIVRRTVNGADPTVYTWDNASRLTSINYRNQTTTYERDATTRLIAKVLPDGIRQEFTYDGADRVLAITYKKSDNSVIETISYTYDAKGQRLSKNSSSASVPETPFTATYSAANRMTSITFTATNQTFNLV